VAGGRDRRRGAGERVGAGGERPRPGPGVRVHLSGVVPAGRLPDPLRDDDQDGHRPGAGRGRLARRGRRPRPRGGGRRGGRPLPLPLPAAAGHVFPERGGGRGRGRRGGVPPPQGRRARVSRGARRGAPGHRRRGLPRGASHHPRPAERRPGARRDAVSAASLSVCMPTWNGGDYVAEALESVLAQTYGDFELLVVDDCSTDRTLDVVSSVKDPRLKLHRNPARLGIPGNWNRCLDLAAGAYVKFLFQDDLLRPTALESLRRAMEGPSRPNLAFARREIRHVGPGFESGPVLGDHYARYLQGFYDAAATE